MKVVRALLILCSIVYSQIQCSAAQSRVITYAGLHTPEERFVIHIGEKSKCETAAIAGARCLPASDFITPKGKLADFSGILWLLGTIGLTGREHVLITGGTKDEKDFVAGILYIVGQQRISIFNGTTTSISEANQQPGVSRSKTREKVFQETMRDNALILPGELANMISQNKPMMVFYVDLSDKIETALPDNPIPGSHNLPVGDDRIHKLINNRPVILYGSNSQDSITALTRLLGIGVEAKALLGGLIGWQSSVHSNSETREPLASTKSRSRLMLFAIIAAIIIFIAGYFFMKLQSSKGE